MALNRVYLGMHVLTRHVKYSSDIWFHVDKYSSAHLYLRLQPGQDWKKLDPKLLQDCAQLVKANSIEGNKKDNIYVIYTPWSNLRKAKDMEVGTIGFKSEKNVKRIFVDKRDNAIVKRLEKTKVCSVILTPVFADCWLGGEGGRSRKGSARPLATERPSTTRSGKTKQGRRSASQKTVQGAGRLETVQECDEGREYAIQFRSHGHLYQRTRGSRYSCLRRRFYVMGCLVWQVINSRDDGQRCRSGLRVHKSQFPSCRYPALQSSWHRIESP